MRRDRTEISADLLKISETGARKTQLVYRGNLNFHIIKKYLRILIDRGLLLKEGDRYYTTEKGRDFVFHADALR